MHSLSLHGEVTLEGGTLWHKAAVLFNVFFGCFQRQFPVFGEKFPLHGT
jgi:hypothetical protein